MIFSWDLLINAIASGILLGGFYAAAACGVTIAFGMLDIVNIAHPAFMMVGAFLAYLGWSTFGFDPLLSIAIMAPFGFVFGYGFYRAYHVAFEQRGDESVQGLAFFFGILFVVEVALVLVFGVDYRSVEAAYLGPTIDLGLVKVSWRQLVPFLVATAMLAAVQLYLVRTFIGRAILAVSQDVEAVRLIGANPVRIKAIAFGIAIATAVTAGVLLIMIQPVEPQVGRDFIGRTFAICVLGGMTSLPGTMIAALLLGITEALTTTFIAPSWSPAVAFGILLLTLTFRPAGILGR